MFFERWTEPDIAGAAFFHTPGKGLNKCNLLLDVFIALKYFPQSSDVGESRFVNFTAANAIFAFPSPNRKFQLFDI
jgi:hypothetical protein